ncbi:hypothetical protein OU995_21775 [Roseateles sp. SL47]|uniref:hypothetical protein n=1 Tax=Roseateles sp. SL47 TaxID=2995138 RepID=UPI00226EB97E|nr:hypothetical protein [Roseateles sp. SL47]WAC72165.1 hypothetical protein OU995_21775 [Roseateles sp. SL47]
MPETLDELNARIDLIELRVVRRDMQFRHHAQSLKARGHAVLAPGHWVRPLLGVGSGWLFWRLVRRRPHRRAEAGHDGSARPGLGAGLLTGWLGALLGGKAADAHGPPASGPAGAQGQGAPGSVDAKAQPELALLQMLTMAWGFMPARIRGSLGPDTTQLVLGLVAGLMHGLQHKQKPRQAAAEPSAAPTAAPPRHP